MIESLNAIRSLGLAPVFEDLYFGREVPFDLAIYMRYPTEFRATSMSDWEPLTAGGVVPIVDDGNFYAICLFDPQHGKFVVKLIEEPETTVAEFASWQQYLADKLLEIAESESGEGKLTQIAEAVGFEHTAKLLSLLREMRTLSGSETDQRSALFIQSCSN